MLAVPGYSGFRRLHEDRNAISSDPGVSDATRHSKFSLAASAVLQKPDTVSSSYTTLTAAASSTLRPTDYKVPDRTGVYVKPPPEAKLIGVSLYSSTFPNYFAEAFKLKDHSSAEYEAAFKRIDTDGSGYITVDEITALLHDVLGAPPSDFQVKSFLAYFDANHDGRVSWEEFEAGLEVVSDNMLATTKTASKPSIPPVSKQTTSLRVIGPAKLAATHDVDMSEPVFPDAPAAFAGTTKDLASGTSKMTKHIPGYSGYLPESGVARNQTAVAQGSGSVKRDTFHAKTNLSITYSRCLPGYSGHIPSNTGSSASVPSRPSGVYAHTESAAASGMVQQYWDARKASP